MFLCPLFSLIIFCYFFRHSSRLCKLEGPFLRAGVYPPSFLSFGEGLNFNHTEGFVLGPVLSPFSYPFAPGPRTQRDIPSRLTNNPRPDSFDTSPPQLSFHISFFPQGKLNLGISLTKITVNHTRTEKASFIRLPLVLPPSPFTFLFQKPIRRTVLKK